MRDKDDQKDSMASDLLSSFLLPKNKKNIQPKKLRRAKNWQIENNSLEEKQQNDNIEETNNNLKVVNTSQLLPTDNLMVDPGRGVLRTQKYINNVFIWCIPIVISFAIFSIIVKLSTLFTIILLFFLSGLFAFLDTKKNIEVGKKPLWLIAVFISPLYLYIRNKIFKVEQWNTFLVLFLYICFFGILGIYH